MSTELKIKSKHLSLEAGVIRFEERKLKKEIKRTRKDDTKLRNLWYNINYHRRWDVRNENRATFIARAYIAGKNYKDIEQKRKPENEYKFQNYIIPRIVSMVQKYGSFADSKISKLEIADWSKL